MAGEAWQQKAQASQAAHEAAVKRSEEAEAARAARIADMEKDKGTILANLQALSADFDKVKADLAAAKAENSTLQAENSTLKAENSHLKVENSALQSSRQGLESQVQRMQESALEALTQRRRAEDDAREKGFTTGRRQGFLEGRQEASVIRFQEGIAHCRTHIMMSPPGQKFADMIVQGLPSAYLHSHAFRREFTPVLSNMISTMILGICEQLDMLERAGDIDVDRILPEVMACAPEVNPAHGESYPWFLDLLREAASAFRGNRGSNAAGVDYPRYGEVNYPMHPMDDAACQTLRLAFEARTVQLLQREADFQLRARGINPEDILQEEEIVDSGIPEAGGENTEIALSETPAAAQTVEGVGFHAVGSSAPPPVPEAPSVEVDVGDIAQAHQGREEEEEEEETLMDDLFKEAEG